MAAIVIGATAAPNTPAGYEYTTRTYKDTPLLADVLRGQELKLTSTGWRLRQAGERADGIALMNGKTGQVGFSIGIVGEMAGVTGANPGTALFPDAGVNGGLNTTVVANFQAQVKMARTGWMRYCYLQ